MCFGRAFEGRVAVWAPGRSLFDGVDDDALAPWGVVAKLAADGGAEADEAGDFEAVRMRDFDTERTTRVAELSRSGVRPSDRRR